MGNDDSKKSRRRSKSDDMKVVRGLSRRDFIKYSGGTVACLYLGTLTGCGSSSGAGYVGSQIARYPIDTTVVTTTTRVLAFSMAQPPAPNTGKGLAPSELSLTQQYGTYGYGAWQFSEKGLDVVKRFDIMPDGYSANGASLTRLRQFAHFFTISDIHITDKEAPNQLMYLQQENPNNSAMTGNTSIYSPIMPYTTQVLDAAIQTINVLHKKSPFTFGISLGDTCNNTSYNELRWYLDVIDGNVISPSSGAHLGAGSVDYQRPYQAAGLDKSILWYQAIGNHDHFYIGSFPVDADPALGLRQAYLSDSVWAVPPALLTPNEATFPVQFDMDNLMATPKYYGGVINGSSPTGAMSDAGFFPASPKVAADPRRRSLLKTEWINEFFTTTTGPLGHGFNLVDPSQPAGFACYSFLPDPKAPLKIIVLDNTQSETDGSHDIHGHGYLDARRWLWLQQELSAGQAADQLMIIAAHVPIAVSSIGAETEWWESDKDPNATEQNAVSLRVLVETLMNTPNLLMWIAGHRHLNTVKAFVPVDRATAPERGFWQVETSSLRDHPQQFRTFEIYLNSDYTVSIVTINVDPAVAAGTPAAKSRDYSVATQQIIQTDLLENNKNAITHLGKIIESMDPSRLQNDTPDPTIFYGDVPNIPYCASYNAELFKQLSVRMSNVLKARYPTT